ncbi:MAG: glycogen synthase GlgA [Candidatus Omnitrophota bacterium]
MKVLLCSSEVVPFAKTGGLADVAGALPIALEEVGIEVIVVMPRYQAVDIEKFKLKKLNKEVYIGKIGKAVTVYFIENKEYFDRVGLYGAKEGDYPDNLERFAFFSRKVLDLLPQIKLQPDVIHCNDWQSALIPVYLKTIYKDKPFYKNIKTILTVHNLAYQGLFDKAEFPKLGLGWEVFTMDGMEFYDKINFLKGGIAYSDVVTTVSETYAKEIQTPEFGCGLEGLLNKRKDSLSGVINGLDYSAWDPARDTLLYKPYAPGKWEDKYFNKTALQKDCGLKVDANIPLLGFVGRLAEQKGLDILAAAMNEITKLKLQMVFLGTGDVKYHNLLEGVAKKFPRLLSLSLRFDNTLAHRIYAGSDIFLMPSRYEPCGLGQMISLKYATIPLVFQTGGLADTIEDFDPLTGQGNGFVFDCYSKADLVKTIKLALYFYANKPVWNSLLSRAVTYDFSWRESAKKYRELYENLKKLS